MAARMTCSPSCVPRGGHNRPSAVNGQRWRWPVTCSSVRRAGGQCTRSSHYKTEVGGNRSHRRYNVPGSDVPTSGWDVDFDPAPTPVGILLRISGIGRGHPLTILPLSPLRRRTADDVCEPVELHPRQERTRRRSHTVSHRGRVAYPIRALGGRLRYWRRLARFAAMVCRRSRSESKDI